MKFWRTTAALALIGALGVASAYADNFKCAKDPQGCAPTFPLVIAKEYQNATSTIVGNGFPWENSSFFFSSFRNQYLYSSSDIKAVSAVTCSIESVSARSVSFTGASTNVYGSFPNGDPSTITVTDSVASSLVSTFALNTGSTTMASLVGTSAAPIIIGTYAGPNGKTLSSCDSCPGATDLDRDMWFSLGDISGPVPDVLFDTTVQVGTGNSGAGVWDTNSTAFGQGSPDGGERAFGSGSFANPNHLTTALGIDLYDFVWVFKGGAPPAPATVEQQLKEVVRLLLTPHGLRCSGLDMNPGNDKIEDDPVQYPGGKDVDPISPQIVGAGNAEGAAVTGDELQDSLRDAGFRHP